MNRPARWIETCRRDGVRLSLLALGCLLIVVSPLVGAIPGPGGVFVFAGGLALILKNSLWARRRYVRLKRRWPRWGHWADWGMRRPSARRRLALRSAKPPETD